MADFTQSMKGFTDRLKSSIEDRDESLAGVRQATTDLLDGARNLLETISLEHDARAEQVHAFMASSRANRTEAVKAMRDSHRESLASMSEAMHHALDQASKSRVEEVNAFMAASHAHRCETSQAMREAHREQLDTMTEELHHTLDEANKSRLEAVGTMRATFKTAQTELASDLRDASKAWRDFANRRNAAPMMTEMKAEVKAEMKPEPTPSAPVEDNKPKRPAKQSSRRKASHHP